MTRLRILVPVLAIAGALASCGDDDGGDATTAPTVASSASPTTAIAPVTAPGNPTTAPASSAATTAPAPATTEAPTTTEGEATATLTLLTYDSFVPPEALNEFTATTGIAVEVANAGDGGTLVNKAILTAGNPEGDVLWGLDNTLLSRALATDNLFVPYVAGDLELLAPEVTALVPNHEVTPVNTGDVCLNYDKAWFADHDLDAPATLEVLNDPAYKDLVVVEDPSTSTVGLAFLLGTVAHFGEDGFIGYWEQLRDNGVLVVDSWDTAYYTEFTAGGGGGSRPIVVSYASSPPATIVYAPDPKPTEPTTGNVDSSCFRSVEFAGILAGTRHEAEAQQLLDFLISPQFQAELPLSNFVYPVRIDVPLPELFTKFAKPVADPLTVSPDEIAVHRDDWIDQWDQAVNS